MTDTGNS